jgi:hypothetical protein
VPEVCQIQGAEGHLISAYLVEWRGDETGYARCTCDWSRQDVLYQNVHSAALAHARTAGPVEELTR